MNPASKITQLAKVEMQLSGNGHRGPRLNVQRKQESFIYRSDRLIELTPHTWNRGTGSHMFTQNIDGTGQLPSFNLRERQDYRLTVSGHVNLIPP
jgi:hypothetical protein